MKLADEDEDGLVTALVPRAQPSVISVEVPSNERSRPMHPLHKKVYDKCVEFTKVPFAIGVKERPEAV